MKLGRPFCKDLYGDIKILKQVQSSTYETLLPSVITFLRRKSEKKKKIQKKSPMYACIIHCRHIKFYFFCGQKAEVERGTHLFKKINKSKQIKKKSNFVIII